MRDAHYSSISEHIDERRLATIATPDECDDRHGFHGRWCLSVLGVARFQPVRSEPVGRSSSSPSLSLGIAHSSSSSSIRVLPARPRRRARVHSRLLARSSHGGSSAPHAATSLSASLLAWARASQERAACSARRREATPPCTPSSLRPAVLTAQTADTFGKRRWSTVFHSSTALDGTRSDLDRQMITGTPREVSCPTRPSLACNSGCRASSSKHRTCRAFAQHPTGAESKAQGFGPKQS
eukprot:scaffold134239_cov27-Tisochrysis_lutea.AAC.2